MSVSELQSVRYAYCPRRPEVFSNGVRTAIKSVPENSWGGDDAIRALLPLTSVQEVLTFEPGDGPKAAPGHVGVLLSGGQAPGGHNVIAGLFDGLRETGAGTTLFGFRGGPDGLIDDRVQVIDAARVDAYRNTGGFDMIGSGRTKLATDAQFAAAVATCKAHGIRAVVIVGGDDSNTNACLFAEHCLRQRLDIQVIGCPKTIDGDLKNRWVETSFGFDTATKVYSDLIGNIARDSASARKYWHFIKLMGRSASHVALECALRTHPNLTLVSEEVRARGMSLDDVVDTVADAVATRAQRGFDYGVCLVPEGLLEFIPEMGALIGMLTDCVHGRDFERLDSSGARVAYVAAQLPSDAARLFESLPPDIQLQLLMDRDSHDNVQVSRIETDKLLITLVTRRLAERAAAGTYAGTFSAQAHFLGYEGRSAAPSNFDADYCYSLGLTAASLVGAGKTGYLACVRHLSRPAQEWVPGGVPLARMMTTERRHGKDVPVIRKALVELEGLPFRTLARERDRWLAEDDYLYPGPIQYFGPDSLCNRITETLRKEEYP